MTLHDKSQLASAYKTNSLCYLYKIKGGKMFKKAMFQAGLFSINIVVQKGRTVVFKKDQIGQQKKFFFNFFHDLPK